MAVLRHMHFESDSLYIYHVFPSEFLIYSHSVFLPIYINDDEWLHGYRHIISMINENSASLLSPPTASSVGPSAPEEVGTVIGITGR